MGFLLGIIYLSFISLGLPDALLGAALTGGATWNTGYRIISVLQIVLTAVLVFSLPKWKEQKTSSEETMGGKVLSLTEIIGIPEAKAIMICFFCYCAVERQPCSGQAVI